MLSFKTYLATTSCYKAVNVSKHSDSNLLSPCHKWLPVDIKASPMVGHSVMSFEWCGCKQKPTAAASGRDSANPYNQVGCCFMTPDNCFCGLQQNCLTFLCFVLMHMQLRELCSQLYHILVWSCCVLKSQKQQSVQRQTPLREPCEKNNFASKTDWL